MNNTPEVVEVQSEAVEVQSEPLAITGEAALTEQSEASQQPPFNPAQLAFPDLWSQLEKISQSPTRHEQSSAEKSRRTLGRVIRRDVTPYTTFFKSKYFPAQGKREIERRKRQISLGRLTVSK